MNAPLPAIETATVMPSIGDEVLLQLNEIDLTSPALAVISKDLPMHAVVVYVWHSSMVNLVVYDHYGNSHKMTSVKFVPPGEDAPAGEVYCELSVIPGELIEGDAVSAHDFGTEGIVASSPERPHTFGEKAVGLSFNPSNETDVYKAKTEAAALIDRAHQLRLNTESKEVGRMASLAITAAQEAQMWLVKAQTWKD
jgi:hypothetical protein